MNQIKDGGPAFPCERTARDGMTIRDYFAIHDSGADVRVVWFGR